MSGKSLTLLMILAAFLLMYLSSTALRDLPAVICMCAAIGLTITALVRTVRELKR